MNHLHGFKLSYCYHAGDSTPATPCSRAGGGSGGDAPSGGGGGGGGGLGGAGGLNVAPGGLNVAQDMARLEKADAVRKSKLYEDRQRELQRFDARMEQNKVVRLLARVDSEAESLTQLTQSRQADQLTRSKQDERLAVELSRLKALGPLRDKHSQLLREGSHELRAVRRKLEAAYTKRTLEAQMREKREREASDKDRERDSCQMLRDNLGQLAEFDTQREGREMMRRYSLSRGQEEQIIAREEAKQAAYLESLQDRAILDQRADEYREEQRRAYRDRVEGKARSRAEIQLFQDSQERWRQKEREEAAAEEERVRAYLSQRTSDTRQRSEERGEREREKERLTDEMARKNYEGELGRQRAADLRQECLELSLQEDQRLKDRDDRETEQSKRVELREIHHRQMAERVSRKQQVEAEDRGHRQQLVKDTQDKDRQGQQDKQRQHERKLELRTEARGTIEHRRLQRAEDTHKVCLQDRLLAGMETTRVDQIEQERLRLLQQHAGQLAGYFPRGLLRDTDPPLSTPP